MRRPRARLLYHYFWPDDVVSAIHFTDLAKGLIARGWQVEAIASNRGCRDESRAYRAAETHQDIAIRRVWRPRFRQASSLGRMANAAWMIAAWSAMALRPRKSQPDVLVIGTDPVLSVLVAWPYKLLQPQVKIAHWCFDLHPESAVADGVLSAASPLLRLLEPLLRRAYESCDLIADLGPCMRAQLERYGHRAARATLVPWALEESAVAAPPDPEVRRQLFGDASLALLYSGNYGRAHDHESFLALARALDHERVRLCFAVRGNRADELRRAAAGVSNVGFAGFVPQSEIGRHLGAADIHLASLKPEWTGLVVPSKFFGSLALGRPVLFAGARDSAIARWIEAHKVGWVLDPQSLPRVVAELRALAGHRDGLQLLQERCVRVYREHFSFAAVCDGWDERLRALLAATRRAHARPFPGATSDSAPPATTGRELGAG
jgi:colanic acid biosynthesis glycosyl transferase WcaI